MAMAEKDVNFKVFLFNNGKVEVRRFAIGAPMVNSYALLNEKLKAIFPNFRGDAFNIKWKDSDGDKITVSSDEEVNTALKEMKAGVKLFYVTVVKNARAHALREPHIICNVCFREITAGYPFECTQCPNYHLCANCKHQGHHADHFMRRMHNTPEHDRGLNTNAKNATPSGSKNVNNGGMFGGTAEKRVPRRQFGFFDRKHYKDFEMLRDAFKPRRWHYLPRTGADDESDSDDSSSSDEIFEGDDLPMMPNNVQTEKQEHAANKTEKIDIPVLVQSGNDYRNYYANNLHPDMSKGGAFNMFLGPTHLNPRYYQRLRELLEMGFSNENGHLTHLLEMYKGDIHMVVAAIIALKLNDRPA